MLDRITVRGARRHNLRNLGLEMPRYTLTVVTGLSALVASLFYLQMSR